jgi:1-pyrroline-5-carboxylate dehydrogenase
MYLKSLWLAIKEQIITDVKSMKMGLQKILVILLLQYSRRFFDKLASFIDQAKKMLMLKSS